MSPLRTKRQITKMLPMATTLLLLLQALAVLANPASTTIVVVGAAANRNDTAAVADNSNAKRSSTDLRHRRRRLGDPTKASNAQPHQNQLQEAKQPQTLRFLDNLDHTERIVGGYAVPSGTQYAFMANWWKGCGGSLVAPDVVLTAAHCEQVGLESPFSFGSIQHNDENAPHVVYGQDYKIHPAYNQILGNQYDLMLIKLKEPVWYQPINLNANPTIPHTTRNGAEKEEDLTVIGFGWQDDLGVLGSSEILRETSVTYIEHCDKAPYVYQWYNYIHPAAHEQHLCAGVPEEGGRDSCYGDSGGPLFYYHAPSLQYVQVGVVSWGVSERISKRKRFVVVFGLVFLWSTFGRFHAFIHSFIHFSHNYYYFDRIDALDQMLLASTRVSVQPLIGFKKISVKCPSMIGCAVTKKLPKHLPCPCLPLPHPPG